MGKGTGQQYPGPRVPFKKGPQYGSRGPINNPWLPTSNHETPYVESPQQYFHRFFKLACMALKKMLLQPSPSTNPRSPTLWPILLYMRNVQCSTLDDYRDMSIKSGWHYVLQAVLTSSFQQLPASWHWRQVLQGMPPPHRNNWSLWEGAWHS